MQAHLTFNAQSCQTAHRPLGPLVLRRRVDLGVNSHIFAWATKLRLVVLRGGLVDLLIFRARAGRRRNIGESLGGRYPHSWLKSYVVASLSCPLHAGLKASRVNAFTHDGCKGSNCAARPSRVGRSPPAAVTATRRDTCFGPEPPPTHPPEFNAAAGSECSDLFQCVQLDDATRRLARPRAPSRVAHARARAQKLYHYPRSKPRPLQGGAAF